MKAFLPKKGLGVKHLIQITFICTWKVFFFLPTCNSIRVYINIYNSGTSYWRFIPLFSQGRHLLKVRKSWAPVLTDSANSTGRSSHSRIPQSQFKFPDFQSWKRKVFILPFSSSLRNCYFCYEKENTPTSRAAVVPDGQLS